MLLAQWKGSHPFQLVACLEHPRPPAVGRISAQTAFLAKARAAFIARLSRGCDDVSVCATFLDQKERTHTLPDPFDPCEPFVYHLQATEPDTLHHRVLPLRYSAVCGELFRLGSGAG